jgi:hypothetical protein
MSCNRSSPLGTSCAFIVGDAAAGRGHSRPAGSMEARLPDRAASPFPHELRKPYRGAAEVAGAAGPVEAEETFRNQLVPRPYCAGAAGDFTRWHC